MIPPQEPPKANTLIQGWPAAPGVTGPGYDHARTPANTGALFAVIGPTRQLIPDHLNTYESESKEVVLRVLNPTCPRCAGTVLNHDGLKICAQCGWSNNFTRVFTHVDTAHQRKQTDGNLLRTWGIWLPLRQWHKRSPDGPAFSKAVFVEVEYWAYEGHSANAMRIRGWPFHRWSHDRGVTNRINRLRYVFKSQVGLTLLLLKDALKEAHDDMQRRP